MTGMNKNQFVHAIKKEKDDFFMFGLFDLKSVNFNPEESNQLRPLTFYDKLNHQRRFLESKMYGKIYEVLTSKKPADFLNLLRDKFSTQKHSLEEGIVIWHE